MKKRESVRNRWCPVLLVAFAAIAPLGCQSLPGSGDSARAVAAAPAAGLPPSASPALEFVATARPGQRATVSDPAFGGSVVVEYETQYHSASNRTCRRFSVSRPEPPVHRETKFACFTAAGLELIDIY